MAETRKLAAILAADIVGYSKLAVPGYIRRKNGCEFSGLGHGSPLTTRQNSTVAGPRQVASPR